MTSGDGVIVFWEQQWNEADSQDPDARSTCCARSSGICSRALSRRDGSAQRGPWLGNGRTCGPVADGPRPAGSRGADVALVQFHRSVWPRQAAGVARARGRTALSCDLSSDQNQLAKGVTTGSSDFYVAHLIKSNTPGDACPDTGHCTLCTPLLDYTLHKFIKPSMPAHHRVYRGMIRNLTPVIEDMNNKSN